MKYLKTITSTLLAAALMLTLISDLSRAQSGNKIKTNIFEAITAIDYISVNILLDEGIDINTTDEQGNTPLMVAAKVGNMRILNIILAYNPDVNRQNKHGRTALIIAAEGGQLQVVSRLLDFKADRQLTDHEGNTALTLASRYGHSNITYLLKHTTLPLAK